jgi:hypothetical protein
MQAQNQMSPAQQKQAAMARIAADNAAARSAILSSAYPYLQSILSTVFQPAVQNVFQFPTQNVGLIKGFLIRLTAQIFNPSAGSSVLTLTPLGPANLVQSFLFSDLQNYQRINTSGWHIAMLDSLKQGRPFLSSTPSDSPMGFGSNWPVIKAPATIPVNTTATIYMYYYVPLSYSDSDLTGAVYGNVVNATMQMQITLATAAQAVVANTGDPTLAIYQGAGAVAGVTLTNVTVQVYQSYLDQLPVGQDGRVILPSLDLNTIYELKNTAVTSLIAGQDFYIPYSNFRHFMSTMVIYDNQLNGVYPAAGTDINFWSLRTANATDLRKADPYTWVSYVRRKLLTDAPLPVYITDTREKPIFTTTSGNMALVMNPSLVNAGASLFIGWEMLANVNNLNNATSLTAS